MQRYIFILIVSLFLLAGSLGLPGRSCAEDRIRVTFLCPAPKDYYPFWNNFIAFMQAAADDLDIDLRMLYASNRFEFFDNAKAAATSPDRPDYLMYIYQAETGRQILKLAEDEKIKSFIVNTDVIASERKSVGGPGHPFKYWVSLFYPDDVQVGFELAEALFREARRLGLKGADGKIHALALAGSHVSSASKYRYQGLEEALSANRDVVLDRMVYANWQSQIAYEKCRYLLESNQDVQVIWSVNDNVALGAVQAAEEVGLQPGKDIVTGGVDWSQAGVRTVRDGRMLTTFGGHFMDGAWQLVMLYDYHHGKGADIAEHTLLSRMVPLTKENLDEFAVLLKQADWPSIDFRRFSRVYNPDIAVHDFSMKNVRKAYDR